VTYRGPGGVTPATPNPQWRLPAANNPWAAACG